MKFLMIKFNDSGMERIYDKPLLETENKPELEEHNKTVFKGFFGSLNGMEQIQNQNYAKPYISDKRKVLKIGVNFDSESKELTEWIVE